VTSSLIALVLAAAAPCPETVSAEPVLTHIDGCGFAACTAAGDLDVCTCAESEDSESTQFGVRRGAEWLSQVVVSAPIPVFSFGGFSAPRADLDGDGHQEIVGALFLGASCGRAVQYWELVIWDGAQPAKPPVRFSVEDFGEGTFARWDGERGCRLLATDWGSGADPSRGEGTYFYGRWARYAGGNLTPVGGDGVLARRLLRSFQDERQQAELPTPLRWLRPRKATYRADPLLPAGSDRTASGKVISLDVKDGRIDLTIALEGERIEYCYGTCPDGSPQLERIGALPAGVAYPKGYWSPELSGWSFGSEVTMSGRDRREPHGPVLWVTRRANP
jgi:hypothetical protein